MLFDWNAIAAPASVQDLQLSSALTLSHGLPARGVGCARRLCSGAATAVRCGRTSDLKPRPAHPDPGGQLPPAVRPADRAGQRAVFERPAGAALPCQGRDLPCRRRADGPPCRSRRGRSAGPPRPDDEPAGLRPAVRAFGRGQRCPCAAAPRHRRHRGHPPELRGPLRRGRAQ